MKRTKYTQDIWNRRSIYSEMSAEDLYKTLHAYKLTHTWWQFQYFKDLLKDDIKRTGITI